MRYLLVLALAFVGFAACKKTENSVTREDELRSGKWKMIAGTQRWDPAIGADTIVHYYDSLPGCKKDDYLVFSENGLGSQHSGNKCDLSEPDEVDFRWFLSENGNTINIYNAFQTFLHQDAVTAPLVNYGPSQFTIRYFEFVKNQSQPSLNDTVTYSYTFQKF